MVKDFRLPKQHKVFKLYKRYNLKTEGTNDLRRLFCTINRVHPTSYYYKYTLQYCCWCPGTSLSNPNCVCNFLLSFFPQGKSFIFIMSEYIDGCSMTLLPWLFMSVQFRQKSKCYWQSSSVHTNTVAYDQGITLLFLTHYTAQKRSEILLIHAETYYMTWEKQCIDKI